ncbi:MAG: zinc transport system ATP-binding protein [Clostridia bacterium]|jgi:zinc transport system ATP-binding protein|nr:zinc transport system ATP-binding protein [Clostridia bacterium]MDN5323476.1 zinc transport system ATP-binding protein [Clostridia bacterium]
MEKSAIYINNISFAYPSQKPIINNVTLNIQKKQFVGIFGPNGAGKSTLIKLILGLLKPSRGKILINGQALENFQDWSKIGYISQKAASFNSSFPATVEEVIAAPLLSKSFLPKITGNIQKKIERALSLVDLLSYKKSLIGNLSGGQQQRVFLARTLITEPEILILDEPFVGIDQTSIKLIFNTLKELNDRGTTIIMITHDLRWLKEEIDLLVCVEKGSIHLHCPVNFKNHVMYHNH